MCTKFCLYVSNLAIVRSAPFGSLKEKQKGIKKTDKNFYKDLKISTNP